MKKWLGGISDAVDVLLSGPQARQTGSVADRREGGPDPVAMWNEWRAMPFPGEFRVGGSSHIVGGIDTEQLIRDATVFLDRYFSGQTPPTAAERREQLIARFDRAIPDLAKEARGYLAMGREVLRRVPIE
jgi:hypothetical protein